MIHSSNWLRIVEWLVRCRSNLTSTSQLIESLRNLWDKTSASILQYPCQRMIINTWIETIPLIFHGTTRRSIVIGPLSSMRKATSPWIMSLERDRDNLSSRKKNQPLSSTDPCLETSWDVDSCASSQRRTSTGRTPLSWSSSLTMLVNYIIDIRADCQLACTEKLLRPSRKWDIYVWFLLLVWSSPLIKSLLEITLKI